MPAPFTHVVLAGRILFGPGRRTEVRDELELLGSRRPLIVCTSSQRDTAEATAAACGGAFFPGAAMHTPVEVTETALAFLQERGCDGLVAIGGGSAVGLSKALAFRTDLPQIMLPTTYAGSEITPVQGETRDGVKTTRSSPRILPETVIYDPELTLSLPAKVTATSGMNAIAHAVEGLYAQGTSPFVALMAEEGLRVMAAALTRLADFPTDLEARGNAQYGAWLCGACLGSAGAALHHKLCHVLGGSFGLPHAETHSVLLPHVAAYNASAAPEAMARAARALGAETAASGLWDLERRLGTPRSLREIGMTDAGIDRAVELVFQSSYPNPRKPDPVSLRRLLVRALNGEQPGYD